MKKYFITGLVILLPLALTIVIVNFLFNLLTDPFVGAVKNTLHYFQIFNSGFWIFNADEIQLAASRILILACLLLFTVLLGALARWFLFMYFVKLWDFVLHRIPLVRSIYKISQDVIRTLFSTDAKSFQQVVLVPYPNENSYCLAFVTQNEIPPLKGTTDSLVSVYLPTTPNPTSGLLLLYREKEVIYLNMKADDAFKGIVSCGVILAPMTLITKEEATRLAEKSHPLPPKISS